MEKIPKGVNPKSKEKGHKFKSHSFKKFTWCENCNDFIWGLSKQGYQCKVCRMPVHKKCMEEANARTNCRTVLASDQGASKFLGFSDAKKISTLTELLEQMESEEFVETFRLQLFVSLISSLKASETGQAFLDEKDPISRIRGKPVKNVNEDDDADKDAFAVLSSYFDHGVDEATVALRVVKELCEDNPDNRQKFCTRGHTSAIIALLKHNPENTEYNVPLEALKSLSCVFLNQPSLREYVFARKGAGKLTGYLKTLMEYKEKVRAKRGILSECKWVGAKLLWDLYNDPNKKFMYYLDDRGALAIIIHAAMEGHLRVWNQVDPKEITRTGVLYDSPICVISTGFYRGEPIAIKEFSKKSICYNPRDFRKEISLLSVVQHPNVCKFYGAYEVGEEDEENDNEIPLMVMEIFERGSLADCLDPVKIAKAVEKDKEKAKSLGIPYYNSRPEFDMRLIVNMAMQAANGIKFLHTKQIIHRDIKTQNCLVTHHWGVAVIDFGVSRVAAQSKPDNSEDEEFDVGAGGNAKPAALDFAKMTLVGTPFWMAPEVLSGQPYNDKADAYSFAFILWAMLTGKQPFENIPQLSLVKHIVVDKQREKIPKGFNEDYRKLIEEAWDPNPDARPNFDDILNRLWNMKDEKGNYYCQTYLRVDNASFKLLSMRLAPRERLSFGLTCKHFFQFYSENRHFGSSFVSKPLGAPHRPRFSVADQRRGVSGPISPRNVSPASAGPANSKDDSDSTKSPRRSKSTPGSGAISPRGSLRSSSTSNNEEDGSDSNKKINKRKKTHKLTASKEKRKEEKKEEK